MFVCPHKVKSQSEMKKCTLKTSENRQDSHLNLHHILTHGPGERARLYCKRIETVLAPVVSFTGGEHRVGWAIRRRHMFLSQPPRFPDWRTSNGQTLTCLIETDEHMNTFFMKLVLGSYRTCLSVPVRPTQILCASPVGSRDHTDFYFVGVFCTVCCFFMSGSSFTRENWVFHFSYAASLDEYFLQSSHLSYSMTSFQSTSKGWIPVFEFWKGVYCRCCLLSSLPSHYPLGCTSLLTLEQLGSRKDLWEFG